MKCGIRRRLLGLLANGAMGVGLQKLGRHEGYLVGSSLIDYTCGDYDKDHRGARVRDDDQLDQQILLFCDRYLLDLLRTRLLAVEADSVVRGRLLKEIGKVIQPKDYSSGFWNRKDDPKLQVIYELLP